MSKVLLIRPRSTTNNPNLTRIPLALLYVGSVLQHSGFQVKVVDTNISTNYRERIAKECQNASVVGITSLTSEVKHGLELCALIRGISNVPIVWGGIHASLYPELTCTSPLVDYVVHGEGEYTMLELANALVENGEVPSVAGLAYKKGSEVVVNPPREYIDLNQMPHIDYSLVSMDSYVGHGYWRGAYDVQSARGCPYKCKFCVNAALGNHKMRLLSADRVVFECERLVKEYNAGYITFVDDNFFINKKRAEDICNGIIRSHMKINWFAEVRADFIKDGFIDSDFLRLAESSGLTNLTIGAESGSPDILEGMGKGITVEDIIRSAVMLSKTNISTAYSFIIGLPGESRKIIIETLDCIREIRGLYPKAVCKIVTLRAYPGSEYTEQLIQQGWLKKVERLSDFADSKYSKPYTVMLGKPFWNSEPDFARMVASYSVVAYNPYANLNMNGKLHYLSVLLLPEKILGSIAWWRMWHLWFGFPVDLYISMFLRKIYRTKLVLKIFRWLNIKP